jgi:hypothetical protein
VYIINKGTSRGANQAYACLKKILNKEIKTGKKKRNTLKINNKNEKY